MSSKDLLKRILNLPGFKTEKKIIVFTVDDYGSIRMPSRKAYKELENKGIGFGDCRFSKYDALESNTDLEELFNVLISKTDINGNHPVFTPVTCPANPDFKKIELNGFEEYYYESFIETAKKYDDHNALDKLYKNGIDLNIFVPELHHLEHLDHIKWMKDLRSDLAETKLAFAQEMYSITPPITNKPKTSYQEALSYQRDENQIQHQAQTIREGCQIFKELFGYKSIYFTPPNGIMSYKHLGTLSESGIKLVDVSRINKEPIGENRNKWHFHYLGQKNKYNQRYFVRNCVFEPNNEIFRDPISKCINMISLAFKSRQPAIISSHRVNFSGYLYPENRNAGLKELKTLLNEIQKHWPDAEFMSVRQLYTLMESK